MFKKTALCIALSTILVGISAQAATVYEKDNGDNLKLYGEVGVGGHFGADYEYGEFYKDDSSYIDDGFATIGVKGQTGSVYYRVEIDYERENWAYGSGDMVTAIDKMFIGYKLTDTKKSYNAIEIGLTDTALDDYDKFGDFTFDTTVETGEAGDQASTLKYEGKLSDFKMGISYSYDAESSSGSAVGDVVNGYVGYFSKYADIVLGAETRSGSEGDSKYGEQVLFALGARAYVTDNLAIGFNAYVEDEDIAQNRTLTDISDPMNSVYVYNDYQTLRNKGGLVSARYRFTEKWEFTGSYNIEAFENWDIESAYGVSPDKEYSWGKERVWGTLGVNFKPSPSVIFAVEGNIGESAQDAYAYARVYF
ncbi:porin [Psychromonas antarctica]|jgi:outer membrane pore protein F|uniref:porin n=1 Tax=Psychromonas antarctica TaxID=67573 RepID=UPI001EE89880|nr:porin [Psychromonas antarctica]MCG6201194.1 porin [Psychromonas antarctica]